MSYFTCECGREFNAPQKFNGHKSHCCIHLAAVGKLDFYAERQARASATGRTAHYEKQEVKKRQAALDWASAKHVCENCGEVMTKRFGSGRFCSRACANTRSLSTETRQKISKCLVDSYCTGKAKESRQKRCIANNDAYLQKPNYCNVCGSILSYEQRFRKTCSDACLQATLADAGKISASTICKRSRNEIAFCVLCENYFGKDKVLHNEPMFNGWDADIILPEFRIAILWNGPWHYQKVTKDHSLEQVQNRDRLKLAEIIKCGFIPYVIKDLSKASSNKVLREFNLFLKYLEEKSN